MVTPVLGCSLLGVQPMLFKVWIAVEVKVWIKNRGMVIVTHLDRQVFSYTYIHIVIFLWHLL